MNGDIGFVQAALARPPRANPDPPEWNAAMSAMRQ
jgi:hypothetical protein